ncbi:hypothetical protein F2Q70_00006138 [Brassica cretica]|uniref:Pentacotripeptide-repeat region of PRORP domain-containing protein n=1 Tax=Brassica cretica TaxID=69181 RepID=A0A8S9IKB6_BRACR|nr:hypothetical protein F2Q70_00006138 [Brassica cretica]
MMIKIWNNHTGKYRFFLSKSRSFSSIKRPDESRLLISARRFNPASYVSLFHTLFRLYLRCGRLYGAARTLSAMCTFGFAPDSRLWNSLLHRFNANCLVPHHKVSLIYSKMITFGVPPDVFAANSLIHSFCKAGRLRLAFSLLRNRVVNIDTVTYNTVIQALCEHGLADEAYGLLSEMVKRGVLPDTVSYNTLINGFCKVGNFARARTQIVFFLCVENTDSCYNTMLQINFYFSY